MSGMTLLQYFQENPVNKVSFGCELIDCTIGKLVCRGVTEISGEAGAGKTQLCLALAIQSILSPDRRSLLGSAAIVTCGEGLFPIKRLSQLAQHYERPELIPPMTVRQILSHIHIEQCTNAEEATEALLKRVPELCRDGTIKLLIIDSLAGMVRHEYNAQRPDQARERTSYIFAVAQQLKWLSDTFKIGVVVVNQVTGVGFTDQSIPPEMKSMKSIPALGLSWSTCVNTRYMITRSNYHHAVDYSDTPTFVEDNLFVDENHIDRSGSHNAQEMITGRKRSIDSSPQAQQLWTTRRSLELIFSPIYPRSSCSFEICSHGVRGIS